MSGRPKAPLVLTEAERKELVALTLRRKTAQALALRARIVLACAQGEDSRVVAARQRVSEQTVCKWRGRFVAQRIEGLLDAPRSGAPRSIDDARVDAVIARTLESVPSGATHCSTRCRPTRQARHRPGKRPNGHCNSRAFIEPGCPRLDRHQAPGSQELPSAATVATHTGER